MPRCARRRAPGSPELSARLPVLPQPANPGTGQETEGPNFPNITVNNFEKEILNFKQICPIEMLDKLKNPISLKTSVKKVS